MALNIGYIKFNGETFPVKVGYGVLKKLQVQTGKDVDLSKLGSDMVMYEKILWYALEVGRRVENRINGTDDVKLTLTEDMMEDVLEECYMPFMRMIPDFFTDDDLEKQEAATPKKKTPVKKKD